MTCTKIHMHTPEKGCWDTPGSEALRGEITGIENFLKRFVTFSEPHYALPLALWVLGTHIFQRFGVFPYLVITSDTKRAGKSRLAELLSFVCRRPRMFAAITPAIMFHAIDTEEPTLFIEEAEQFSSEAANDIRAVLNVGYRKGQMVPRMTGNDVREYKTYCPKVLILIGKPFDTLLDRSVIIKMKRAEAPERFIYDLVKTEGETRRYAIESLLNPFSCPENHPHSDEKKCARAATETTLAIEETHRAHPGLPFLTDRDEEIWGPLFAIAQVVCPERLKELTAAAVDICTEKTDTTTSNRKTLRAAEEHARDDEYGKRLADHCARLMDDSGRDSMGSAELIAGLHRMEEFPWRKYLGTGLNARMLADMLAARGIRTARIRMPGKREGKKNFGKVVMGYKRASFDRE
jgi:hypothetical protein